MKGLNQRLEEGLPSRSTARRIQNLMLSALLAGVWLTLLPALHPAFDTLSAFRVYALAVCLVVLAWCAWSKRRKLLWTGMASLGALGLGLGPHVAWPDPPKTLTNQGMRILQANLRYDNQEHSGRPGHDFGARCGRRAFAGNLRYHTARVRCTAKALCLF